KQIACVFEYVPEPRLAFAQRVFGAYAAFDLAAQLEIRIAQRVRAPVKGVGEFDEFVDCGSAEALEEIALGVGESHQRTAHVANRAHEVAPEQKKDGGERHDHDDDEQGEDFGRN